MDRSNVLILIGETYQKDAIAQLVPAETQREVFCNITSVSASEWFDAGRNGLKAEYRATVFAPDYEGEKEAVLDGERYAIYRTYLGKNENLELYLGKKVGTG